MIRDTDIPHEICEEFRKEYPSNIERIESMIDRGLIFEETEYWRWKKDIFLMLKKKNHYNEYVGVDYGHGDRKIH